MIRHFLRDDDLSCSERNEVLDLADELRDEPFSMRVLDGPRTVAVLFDKPSTRTRVSFSVGIAEMGGFPLVLDTSNMQLERGESIADTARVLSSQVSAIVWRTYAQTNLEEMAAHSSVPVVNALTDRLHPCQSLADALTVRDEFGGIRGLTVTFLGDIGNNVANSTMLVFAAEGAHVRLAGPAGVDVDAAVLASARDAARRSGGSVVISDDAKAASYEADVLVTDTWTSMGDAPMSQEKKAEYRRFALDEQIVDVAAPDAIVLHCLPAHRGEEIATEVIDGPRSRVWQQAENRLHVQKALLAYLLQSRMTLARVPA